MESSGLGPVIDHRSQPVLGDVDDAVVSHKRAEDLIPGKMKRAGQGLYGPFLSGGVRVQIDAGSSKLPPLM